MPSVPATPSLPCTVHAAHPGCVTIMYVPCCIPRVQVLVNAASPLVAHAAHPFILHVHSACQCCMSMLRLSNKIYNFKVYNYKIYTSQSLYVTKFIRNIFHMSQNLYVTKFIRYEIYTSHFLYVTKFIRYIFYMSQNLYVT